LLLETVLNDDVVVLDVAITTDESDPEAVTEVWVTAGLVLGWVTAGVFAVVLVTVEGLAV
jgi:hypothetical protein